MAQQLQAVLSLKGYSRPLWATCRRWGGGWFEPARLSKMRKGAGAALGHFQHRPGRERCSALQRGPGRAWRWALPAQPHHRAAQLSRPQHRPPLGPSTQPLTSLLFPSEKLGTHSTSLAMVPGSACSPRPRVQLLVSWGFACPLLSHCGAKSSQHPTRCLFPELGFLINCIDLWPDQSQKGSWINNAVLNPSAGAGPSASVLPPCQSQHLTVINHHC